MYIRWFGYLILVFVCITLISCNGVNKATEKPTKKIEQKETEQQVENQSITKPSYEFGGKLFKKSLHGYSFTDSLKRYRIDAKPSNVHVHRYLSDWTASKVTFYEEGTENKLNEINLIATHPYIDFQKNKSKTGRISKREQFGTTKKQSLEAFNKSEAYIRYAQAINVGGSKNVVTQQTICSVANGTVLDCMNTIIAFDNNGKRCGEVKDLFGQLGSPVLSVDHRYLIYLVDQRPEHGSRIIIKDLKKNKNIFEEKSISYKNTSLIQDRDSELILVATEDKSCAKRYKAIDLKKGIVYTKCFTTEEWNAAVKEFTINLWTASELIENNDFEELKY